MGIISEIAIAKLISFRKTPFNKIKKYFKDMMFVNGISHWGIFSTGVAKPDIRIYGTISTKAPNIPCCCVDEIEDIKSPIPTIENKKEINPIYKIITEPVNGTAKNVIATRNIILASTKVIKSGVNVFPSIKIVDERGDTKSCSKVPSSLSLAIDNEVSKSATNIDKLPIKFGSIHQKLSRFGLYKFLCIIVLLSFPVMIF